MDSGVPWCITLETSACRALLLVGSAHQVMTHRLLLQAVAVHAAHAQALDVLVGGSVHCGDLGAAAREGRPKAGCGGGGSAGSRG